MVVVVAVVMVVAAIVSKARQNKIVHQHCFQRSINEQLVTNTIHNNTLIIQTSLVQMALNLAQVVVPWIT